MFVRILKQLNIWLSLGRLNLPIYTGPSVSILRLSPVHVRGTFFIDHRKGHGTSTVIFFFFYFYRSLPHHLLERTALCFLTEARSLLKNQWKRYRYKSSEKGKTESLAFVIFCARDFIALTVSSSPFLHPYLFFSSSPFLHPQRHGMSQAAGRS